MRIPPLVSVVLVASTFVFFGCDSDESNPPSSISVSGRVSEDVKGAVISASSVQDDGQLVHHPDTAVVQSDGRYLLRIDDADDVNRYVLVEAVTDSLSTSVILFRPSSAASSVAAPMSDETDAEADVFVESRSSASDLTFPRIAALVDAAVAAELQDGTVSAGNVAMLLLKGQTAEDEYIEQ